MTTPTIEEMTAETLRALAARLRVLAATLDENGQHGRAVNTLEDAQSADLHADKWASALEQLTQSQLDVRILEQVIRWALDGAEGWQLRAQAMLVAENRKRPMPPAPGVKE